MHRTRPDDKEIGDDVEPASSILTKRFKSGNTSGVKGLVQQTERMCLRSSSPDESKRATKIPPESIRGPVMRFKIRLDYLQRQT